MKGLAKRLDRELSVMSNGVCPDLPPDVGCTLGSTS